MIELSPEQIELKIAKMTGAQTRPIARWMFDNRFKYHKIADIAKRLGLTSEQVTRNKYCLSKNHGFIFDEIGGTKNKKFKLIGFASYEGEVVTRGLYSPVGLDLLLNEVFA